MALPVTFGNQTVSTGAQLDQNFAALGKLTPLTGTIAGTNALTLSLLSNSPAVAAFANGNSFVGVAVNTNTLGVTLTVGALGPLNVYKDTTAGPVALVAGDIVQGNAYGFLYDSTLNTGAGGFHLQPNFVLVNSQTVATVTFTNTPANSSQDQNVTLSGASVGYAVMLGPPTSVIAGVMYMGYVPAAGTVAIRAANITAASLTPTGGAFRVAVRGPTF